ncbi:pentatricopeptide repeat-containing protein At2g20540 [Aristolochia californica]|uniref:pentatricopeptide repeat-containing protein At2g20540 n=1 Tax=Aristolochia californica TaxID=171875 RepID=UPI0035D5F566
MKISVQVVREMEDRLAFALQKSNNMLQLKEAHAYILKSSLSESSFLATKMVNICSKYGETTYARLIFGQVNEPNVFLYNAIVQAYTQNEFYIEAVSIYQQLLRFPKESNRVTANKFTYPFVIKASGGLRHLYLGKLVHGQVCKCGPASNSIIENSLMEMYTKCDALEDAQDVFDRMTDRDVVSWNTLIFAYCKLGKMRKAAKMFESMPTRTIISWTTMISGCSQNELYSEALEVFHKMQVTGVKPDAISIVAVLPACSQLGALELGRWFHVYSGKHGLLKLVCVCNALIEMYVKCGSIQEAYQLFNSMQDRDVISWSAMIGGFANHGKAHEALHLFLNMEQARVKPNGITYLGVLSACAHAGFLSEGLQYLTSMTKDHSIPPGIEHYGCMVDLLGRSGCLDQALELINKMTIVPDATIWGSLLSACRTHGNIKIAIIAMEHLVELEPDDTGNYILLSNTYAAAGMWDEVARMRKLIRSKGMKKAPGCSLIEVNNVVQEFVVGDDSYPLPDEVSRVLKLLAMELRQRSCVNMVVEEDLTAHVDIFFNTFCM